VSVNQWWNTWWSRKSLIVSRVGVARYWMSIKRLWGDRFVSGISDNFVFHWAIAWSCHRRLFWLVEPNNGPSVRHGDDRTIIIVDMIRFFVVWHKSAINHQLHLLKFWAKWKFDSCLSRFERVFETRNHNLVFDSVNLSLSLCAMSTLVVSLPEL